MTKTVLRNYPALTTDAKIYAPSEILAKAAWPAFWRSQVLADAQLHVHVQLILLQPVGISVKKVVVA